MWVNIASSSDIDDTLHNVHTQLLRSNPDAPWCRSPEGQAARDEIESESKQRGWAVCVNECVCVCMCAVSVILLPSLYHCFHPHTHVRSRTRAHTHVRTNTRAHAHIHTQHTMGSDLPLPCHGRKCNHEEPRSPRLDHHVAARAKGSIYGNRWTTYQRWTHDERSCQRVLVWICVLRRRMHLHVYTSALRWRHSYQFEMGRAILLPSQRQGLLFSETKSSSDVKTSTQSDICAAAHSMENPLGGRWFYGYVRTPNQQVHCRQRTQHRSGGKQCARILIVTKYKRSKTAFIVTFFALSSATLGHNSWGLPRSF